MAGGDQVTQRTMVPALDLTPGFSLIYSFVSKLSSAEQSGLGVRLFDLRASIEGGEAQRLLVEPTTSFFRDIVNIAYHDSGIPLVVLLEPPPTSPEDRLLEISFPEVFTYEAEGDKFAMSHAEHDRGQIRCAFHDSFAFFESGHIFYNLAISSFRESHMPACLDEYHVIQLQKLANPTEKTDDLRTQILWNTIGDKPLTLTCFIKSRLKGFADDQDGVNAVQGLLKPYVMQTDDRVLSYGWGDLKSAIVQIDGPSIFHSFTTAFEKLQGLSDEELERNWSDADAQHSPPAHLPPSRDQDIAKLFAICGIVQNVADFPRQDTGELRDSFDAIVGDTDFLIFNHPTFTFELSEESRSFEKMVDCLGGCPYFLLSSLLVVYNEVLMGDVERHIEELQYGKVDEMRARRASLVPIGLLIRAIGSWWGASSNEILKTNIQRRFEIFRDLLLRYVPNIFRYETERKFYDAVCEARGLNQRHRQLLDLLGRYEGVVRDVHELSRQSAQDRTNILLLILALIAAWPVAIDVNTKLEMKFDPLEIFAVLATLIVVVLVAPRKILFRLWHRRRSRRLGYKER